MGRPGRVVGRARAVGHREPLADPRKGRRGPVQNIGAYGCEAGDSISGSRCTASRRAPCSHSTPHTAASATARASSSIRSRGGSIITAVEILPLAYAASETGLRRRGARGRSPRRRHAAQHPRGDLLDPPRKTSRPGRAGQRGQFLQESRWSKPPSRNGSLPNIPTCRTMRPPKAA